MRQVHVAGEKLFIDYFGPTVPIVNRHTGEVREAQVFIAVLGASSHTYAEVTYTLSPCRIESRHTGAHRLNLTGESMRKECASIDAS
jgi:transposase